MKVNFPMAVCTGTVHAYVFILVFRETFCGFNFCAVFPLCSQFARASVSTWRCEHALFCVEFLCAIQKCSFIHSLCATGVYSVELHLKSCILSVNARCDRCVLCCIAFKNKYLVCQQQVRQVYISCLSTLGATGVQGCIALKSNILSVNTRWDKCVQCCIALKIIYLVCQRYVGQVCIVLYCTAFKIIYLVCQHQVRQVCIRCIAFKITYLVCEHQVRQVCIVLHCI